VPSTYEFTVTLQTRESDSQLIIVATWRPVRESQFERSRICMAPLEACAASCMHSSPRRAGMFIVPGACLRAVFSVVNLEFWVTKTWDIPGNFPCKAAALWLSGASRRSALRRQSRLSCLAPQSSSSTPQPTTRVRAHCGAGGCAGLLASAPDKATAADPHALPPQVR